MDTSGPGDVRRVSRHAVGPRGFGMLATQSYNNRWTALQTHSMVSRNYHQFRYGCEN